jgi:hypothetical protein
MEELGAAPPTKSKAGRQLAAPLQLTPDEIAGVPASFLPWIIHL